MPSYSDIMDIDYSGRMDEYSLPLTTSPEDAIIGRYGERMIPLNFGVSVARRFSNKGTSAIGLNIDPIRRMAPLFGDFTAGASEFINRKFFNKGSMFGKVAGAAGSFAGNVTGNKLQFKFLTRDMISSNPMYEGLYSGMNILYGTGSKSSMPKLPGAVSSGFGAAKKFFTGTGKVNIAAGAALSYGVGGLVGRTIGDTLGLEGEDLDVAESLGNLSGLGMNIGWNVGRYKTGLSKTAKLSLMKGLRENQVYGSSLRFATEQMSKTPMMAKVSGAISNVMPSTSKAVMSASTSAFRSGIGKVLGAGLAGANILAAVDAPLSIAETISDIYTHAQLDYITGYEQRQIDTFNAPSNVKKINRNLNFAGSNEKELQYLLSQPNLARDAAYRYRDTNYGI